jgi:hypothetical protein
MLRVNTNRVLGIPPFGSAGADDSLFEQRLNEMGRGKLLS